MCDYCGIRPIKVVRASRYGPYSLGLCEECDKAGKDIDYRPPEKEEPRPIRYDPALEWHG
jgi:hypothetical protein